MTWEERRLFDTTPEQAWTELTEMVTRANRGENSGNLAWPPVDVDAAWQRFTTERAGSWYWRGYAHGYGRTRFSDLTSVVARMGWQIDHGGRRHVHLAAGTNDSWGGEGSWPLEALVYREHGFFYQAGTGDQAVFLVVCGCGAIGTRGEIGWMGDRCGPCHDRTQEGTPLPAWFPTREWVCDMGEISQLGRPRGVSPDGQRILVIPKFRTGGGSQPSRGVLVWNDANQSLDAELDADDEVAGIGYTADGARLVILTRVGQEGRLRIHDAASLRLRRRLDFPGWGPSALALAPDSKTAYVATSTGERLIVSLDAKTPSELTPTGLVMIDEQVVSPDGRSMLVLSGLTTLIRCSLDTDEIVARRHLSSRHVGIVWPDDHLVGLVSLGGELDLCDATTLASVARFHRGSSQPSYVTQVGPWLVVVQDDSGEVALWPWQPLVEYVRRQA
jgi:hypothetical protein